MGRGAPNFPYSPYFIRRCRYCHVERPEERVVTWVVTTTLIDLDMHEVFLLENDEEGIVGKTCPSLSPGSDSEAPTEPMWYWDHWQARGLVFSMFLGLWYWRGLVRGVMSWWGLVFLFLSCLYVHGSIENVVPDCILVCESPYWDHNRHTIVMRSCLGFIK